MNNNKVEKTFDEIEKESFVTNQILESQHVENLKPLRMFLAKEITPYVQESDIKKYEIELVSDSLSLNDFIYVMLADTDYSFSSVYDVPSINVSLSGEYNGDEIIQIIQNVCRSLGYRFVVSNNFCTVEKENSDNVSGLSVRSYEFRFMIPTSAMIEEIKTKFVGINIFVVSNKLTCIGHLSEIEVLMQFLKSIDVYLFDGFYISFVVAQDASKSVERLKRIISFADSNINNHVSIVPISENVFAVVSRAKRYINVISDISQMMSNCMDVRDIIYDIDLIYRNAKEAYEFVRAYLPETLISYDNQNNKLYVKGSYAEYESVVKLLSNFDVMPRQVQVNLYLIDIKSSNSIDIGTDWFVSADNFQLGQTELIYPLTGGINAVLTAGDIQQYFSFLEKQFDARVISRPSIYLKSGQTSKITIGSSVPFISSKSESNIADALVQNVDYRDIGIIFEITGEVAKNGDIIFSVYVENSSMQEKAGVEDNPIFTSDSVRTKFIMHDSSLCVLGGIKSDNREEVTKGIPLLRKLPILKYLFGAVSKSKENREMLICIYPRIINEKGMDEISNEIMKNLGIIGEKENDS